MQERLLQTPKYIWILVGIGCLLVIQAFAPQVTGLTDPGGRSLPDYSVISRPPQWLIWPIAEQLNTFFDYVQNDLGLVVVTRAIAAPFWDGIIDWITKNLFDPLQVVRTFLSLNILIPMRDFYLYLPWLAVLLLAVGTAYIIGGLRAIWAPLIYIGFIAISGWWDRAMIIGLSHWFQTSCLYCQFGATRRGDSHSRQVTVTFSRFW